MDEPSVEPALNIGLTSMPGSRCQRQREAGEGEIMRGF
jgi:hypothetical protein